MFDGENLTAEKHIQAFEHFADFFEIQHDDVSMIIFSHPLQGDAKAWFRHLQPKSIISSDELSEVFLRFWGEKKSSDWYLLEFHGIQRQRDETISTFNRIFSSLYYKMPKEIQPPEATPKLCYATTFIQI